MKGNHKATAFQVSEGLKAFQVPKKRRAFQGTGGRRGTRTPPSSFFGHVFMAFCLVGLLGGGALAEVSEAQVKEVARELACLCGSCPSRPMDECRCGYAGDQRERISKALEAGQTKDQVIAGFVGEFGQRIFVVPPAEGFNLMAWFMPIFGILVGGYAVQSVLRGWSRDERSAQAAQSAGVSDEDREKLNSLLKDNEG